MLYIGLFILKRFNIVMILIMVSKFYSGIEDAGEAIILSLILPIIDPARIYYW